MSSLRSLTWLSPAICGEIAADVDQALSEWAGEWKVPVARPARCEVVAAGAQVAFACVDLFGKLPRSWNESLAQALFGFDAPASPVVAAVLQLVVDSLQGRLDDAFGPTSGSSTEPAPMGDQGVHVEVELLGHLCGFDLTCSQLRACGRLKPATPQVLARVNLEKALANVPVPLVAELGQASVNVEELMHLQLGDVLLLDQSLNTPMRVFSPGSSLNLPAHLGVNAHPPQLAMRWLAS